METTTQADVIKARRKDIAGQAECEGCGTTLAECQRLARENTDPTAPPWFGCCAMGTGMAPCNHRPNRRLLSGLLDEIEAGEVRLVADVVAEREAKEAKRREARAKMTPPGRVWPLSYAGMYAQDEWWLTKDSGWIRIADMAPSHRANTVRFLERRAAHIADKVTESEIWSLGDAPADVMDSVLAEARTRRANPLAWLQGTALYRALDAGVELDGIPDDLEPVDPATLADHPFHGFGQTCSKSIEGVGDSFIRCSRPTEEHDPSATVAE